MGFEKSIPIIGAGINFLGGLFNGGSQARQNKLNRQWQEKMWNMNNEYNKPINQMARYKEAGLNPHLIYGQGNSGNSAMPSAPKTEAPQYNFADTAMTYVALRKQQTEVDNMEKTREVMDSQIRVNQAQEGKILSDTASTDLQRRLSEELYDTNVATALANLRNVESNNKKIEADIQQIGASTNLTRKQIDKITQEMTESKERIKLMQIDGNNKQLEAELKRIEIEIRKNGGNPNDPGWQKVLFEIFKPLETVRDARGLDKDIIEGAKNASIWGFNLPIKAWKHYKKR